MRKISWALIATLMAMAFTGCASVGKDAPPRQAASIHSFLFSGSEKTAPIPDQVAEIKVPFRIGIAFVPDNTYGQFTLPEADRLKLAGKVRDAFSRYPFVSEIDAVPSMYLVPSGGFTNLDQIAAMLKLDVIALVSYDQVQNAGATAWSFLYWTLIGAYFVNGDQYDILTAVETAVFDIKSRRMLMRAAGISDIKGTAPIVGFSERAREARTRGFDEAITEMIGKLDGEVKTFRERAPKDPSMRLILPPGYNPNESRPAAQ